VSDSWVGFRPSPKKDASKSTSTLTLEASSNLMIAKVLKFLTTQQGVETWLVNFTKFDARLGAKLKFSFGEENFGGTYARIDIPKRIILLTEIHGEIDFRLTEKIEGTDILLKVTKTLDVSEKSDWELLIHALFDRFLKVVADAN
jgi:uncharacterized protein YndB with AHSA1/START domain